MHILVTNDDGPPSNKSSPYVHSLVSTLQAAGHTVSVVLPHVQRSWIGKAHMVGQTLTPTYFRPGTLLEDDGITQGRPFNDGKEEWILIDGTPASCAQLGVWHLFNDRGPVDLVISGPNYGRNTTAVFALSSGTVGGAMEGAVMGKKAIALSYAFDSREHDPEILAAASQLSTKLIEKLVRDWPEDVHIYSVNVPLRSNVSTTRVLFTEMLQNQWTSGSSFTELPGDAEDADPDEEEKRIRSGETASDETASDGIEDKKQVTGRSHVTFKWTPNFTDVRKYVEEARKGDGWHVLQGHVTVTPLRANFWHLPHYSGEIKLNDDDDESSAQTTLESKWKSPLYSYVAYDDPYVQPLITNALQTVGGPMFKILDSWNQAPPRSASDPVLQIAAYEKINFEHVLEHPETSMACAYVIRKALIRKHYLSNTISAWLAKHPSSILATHFKPCVHFELDFAEFLDEALVDAWDLHESMKRNEAANNANAREWWILKPGMSDGGNGIRLFSSMDALQAIFEQWEGKSDDSDHGDGEEQDPLKGDKDSSPAEGEAMNGTAAMTSQLRHFIAQPYIDPPLLLPNYSNKKFHVRAYVVAVGALKIFVYRDMLALFAASEYQSPNSTFSGGDNNEETIDLGTHLTNTCFQDESTRDSAVHRFWDIKENAPKWTAFRTWQEEVYSQICSISGEVFEAAAREQMIHFQTIPNAFEVFGVDFLVDARYRVWLLEVNAYPDFKQTGQALQDTVVGGLFEEITKVAVLPFFGYDKYNKGTEKMSLVRTVNLGRK